MNAPHYGPWQRRLMGVHDQKLRRCWACGAWAYGEDDCNNGCGAPAQRPHDLDERKTS